MTEATLQALVMKECGGNPAVRLFRNQTGSYELKDGRWITSGLAPGSADLIGWRTITVTPDMVGKKLAVFASVELKAPSAPKRLPEHQENWRRVVEACGGFAGFARTVEDARKILRI